MQCPAAPRRRRKRKKIEAEVISGVAKLKPLRHRATPPLTGPFEGRSRSDARVAQLVEHMTENHGVGGSTPSPGTIATLA